MYVLAAGAEPLLSNISRPALVQNEECKQDGKEYGNGRAEYDKDVLHEAGDDEADHTYGCDKERVRYLRGNVVDVVTLRTGR